MPPMWSRPRHEPLAVHSGSAVKRDVYKVATAGLTGVTAFGALAVTGVVAGTAAREKALQDAQQKTAQPAAPATQVVTKRRKHRTVVRTRVVHAASTGAASTGTGGTISRPSSGGGTSSGGHSSGGGGTTTHSSPKPAAPNPPPAPSSGS